jgi:2-polyprenyl-3-methyl-5-hydroxy-6-metoxy-1,4-benzoquinol methylase
MKFYSEINEYYDFVFKTNQAQVDFVNSFAKENSSILEIGCGTGSLALKLASKTREIEAIDFDVKMVEKAKEKNNPNSINFQQMDMLDIQTEFSEKKFNVVSCFGNTLVHLTSLNSIKDFCNAAFNVLDKKGSLLIQTVNYDKILDENISSLPLIDNEEVKFERRYNFNTNTGLIEFSTSLFSKSTKEEINNSIDLFPLRKSELEAILKDIGFNEIEFYGNFKKTEWSKESMPTIVKCSR